MARVILLPYANPSPRLSEPRLHHLQLAPEAFPGASSYSPWFVQHLLEAYGVMLSLPAPGIAIQAKTFQVEGGKSPFSLLPESRRRITGVFLTWQAAYETTALHVSPVGWQARSIAKGVGDGTESRHPQATFIEIIPSLLWLGIPLAAIRRRPVKVFRPDSPR